MSDHLNPETIWTLVQGDTPEDARVHLADCATCQAALAERARLAGVLADARLPRVAESLVEATVRRVLEAAEPAPARLPEVVRTLAGKLQEMAASLVADSWVPSAAVRSGERVFPRALLFENEAYSISLSLAEADDAFDVTGQFVPRTGESLPDAMRVFLHHGETCTETEVSEFGDFRFSGVPRRRLELSAALGDRLLRLGPIGDDAD